MEVHFTPELQAKLDRVASDIHSGADEYVQQLVEHYLDQFRQKVAGSLEQLDRTCLVVPDKPEAAKLQGGGTN